MAALGPPQTLPPPSFLGPPEQRHTLGTSLPAIHTLQARQRDSNPFPPIQLPPLQISAPGPPPFRPPPGKTFSIQQLLSNTPAPTRPTPLSAPTHPQAYPHVYPQPHHQAVPGVPSYLPPAPAVPQQHPHTAQRDSRQPHVDPHSAPARARPSFTAAPFTSSHSPTTTSHSPSLYSASPRSSTGPPLTAPPPTTATTITQPPPFTYDLLIRQQPLAARACGFGEKDRRVIDPPPIIELRVTDASGAPREDRGALLALHCTLMTEDGTQDDAAVQPAEPNTQPTRRLMGNMVASPYYAKDEHGRAGTFFVFPDLSCRAPGRFRLRLRLIRIQHSSMKVGMQSPTVVGALTDVFTVFTAKDFPGMRASSALLKALRRQGLSVGVKKGSEARKGKGKVGRRGESEESSGDEEGSEEEDGEGEGRREIQSSRSTAGGAGGARGVAKTKPSKKVPKKRRRSS
ncbi:hypothetical protein LTR35_010385 [Friedmanniomyces endolithicus]|uniref:Velvet domain-containing protein n=1 Tax=Friedmanniomyces endolithicus TaxID=329885 RepID=A0AAN6JCL0_9PEZI|nr:hypothetical protein LTR35_010385 [Friedmanniomyces endolithicus]KAK0294242.1 hypothetical protein LTS00_007217 [Friedmanniomyces endolithicus]KAK0325462.1 hypothetical protein LTR82_003745 [Friedmanniomyces endolithicus]KAK1003296.1 hypothetical protein LTR54_007809 [Friedmanniomyces endolithicus]